MRLGDERHEYGHEGSRQKHLRHAPSYISEKCKLPASEDEMERKPGDYKGDEQDAEKNGDVEIEQPPPGIEEDLGIKGTIDEEECHEEEWCGKEIPNLHGQPPEYVRDLFHIVTKSILSVFHPKYSILIPKNNNLSHFLIPHNTCFHVRKAGLNFASEN